MKIQYIFFIIIKVYICSILFVDITYANNILFNEIMWMGSSLSTADEWIELYNPTNEVVSLSGYTLYGAKSNNGIIIFNETHVIQPNDFFLISNYNINNTKTILNISPSLIDTSLSLSNTNLNLKLINNNGDIVDEVKSICAGDNGSIKKSMIKINTGISIDCINWGSSQFTINIKNTDKDIASPMAHNIEVNNNQNENNNTNNDPSNNIINNPPIAIIDLQSNTQTSGILNLKINVTGTNSYDIDGDSIKCDWDFGNGYFVYNNCNPTYYTYSGVGIYNMILTVTDSKNLSSSSSITFSVYDKPIYSNKIRINEVYSNPVGKDIDEWIELYNFDTFDIDLNNWYLQVNSNTKKYLSGTIKSNEYKVFSKEELKFTISNYSGVYVNLYNPNNELVDNFVFNTNVNENLSMSYISGNIILTHQTKNAENIFYNNAPKAIIKLQSSGKSIGFDNLSINPISESIDIDNDYIYCDWDFGDGYFVYNNCNPPSYTYNKIGNYKLKLTVKDIFGYIDETYVNINVYPHNFDNNGGSQNISKKIEYQMLYCPVYNSGMLMIEDVNIDDSKNEYFILYNSGNDIIDLSCVIFFDSKKYKVFNNSTILHPNKSIKIFAKELKLDFYQTKESIFEIYNAKNELIASYYIQPKLTHKKIKFDHCSIYESGSLIILDINIDSNKDEYFIIKNTTNTGIDLSCIIFDDNRKKKSFSSSIILESDEIINVKTKDIGLNFLQKKDNELFIYNIQNELIAYFYKKYFKKIDNKQNEQDNCILYNSGSISIAEFDFSKNKDEYFVIQNNTNDNIDLKCLVFFDSKKNKKFKENIILRPNETYKIFSKDIGLNFLQKKDNELFIYNINNELIAYYFFEYKNTISNIKNKKINYEDECINLHKISIIDFYPETKEFLFYNNSNNDIDLRCLQVQYKDKVHKTDYLILYANTGTIVSKNFLNINPAKLSGSIILISYDDNILYEYKWANKRKKENKEIIYIDGELAIAKKMKSGTKIYIKNAIVITTKNDIAKNDIIIQGKNKRYKLKLQKNQNVNRGDKINIYGSIARNKGNIYIKSNIIKISKKNNLNNKIQLNNIDEISKYIVGNSYKNKILSNAELNHKIYQDVYIEGKVCGSQKIYVDICLINGEKIIIKNKYKYKLSKGDMIYIAGVVSKYGEKNIIIPHTKLSMNIYEKWKIDNDIAIAKYNEYIRKESQKSIFDKIIDIINEDINRTKYYFANLFM